MKGVFAIWLSVLLLGMQAVCLAGGEMASSAPVQAAKCCRPGTHCYKTCCLAKEKSPPVSSPMTPSRTVSQTDWQLLAAPMVLVFQAAPDVSSKVFSSDFSASSVTAVPLYQRTCSYLL